MPIEPPRRKALGADYDQTTPVSEIKEEQVTWIFHDWIPAGKISVLIGEPGVGKSHLTLDIAARLTTGRPMPNVPHSAEMPAVSPSPTLPVSPSSCLPVQPSDPSTVILLASEDAVSDTIRPRLEAAGADCGRIRVVTNGGRSLLADPYRLAVLTKIHGASLIIVDPLSAYAGRNDIHRDQHMRRLLSPLAQVADTTGAAILLVHHINKSERGNALMRSAGSIGIAAIARSVLMVGRDPIDPGFRIMAHVKSNLTSSTLPIRFHFEQIEGATHSRICWDGVAEDLNADALLNSRPLHNQNAQPLNPHALAKRFLRETLASGPMSSRELIELAEERGISRSTFKRAKLEITTSKRSGGLGALGSWQTELAVSDAG